MKYMDSKRERESAIKSVRGIKKKGHHACVCWLEDWTDGSLIFSEL